MTKIYDQHDAAFKSVSAYVVLKDGKVVAKVAFKFGGAVTAYVHWIGTEMQRGQAGGGGYDRQSAAVAKAADKLLLPNVTSMGLADPSSAEYAFFHAARKDGGNTWLRSLENAGFVVVQAV
jgi:hypothetical protein